jgi:hypothetical protein
MLRPRDAQPRNADEDDVMVVNTRLALREADHNVRRSPRKHASPGGKGKSPASLPTPPSSSINGDDTPTANPSMSLLDFYGSLDKIERTSPMSVRFLEAYAERLHDEVCGKCWFEQSIGKVTEEGEGDGDGDVGE